MPEIKFNRFYRYAEMTRILKEYVKEYPNLLRMESQSGFSEFKTTILIVCMLTQNFIGAACSFIGAMRITKASMIFWPDSPPKNAKNLNANAAR